MDPPTYACVWLLVHLCIVSRCIPTAEPHGDNLDIYHWAVSVHAYIVTEYSVGFTLMVYRIALFSSVREARSPTPRRTNVNYDASIIDLSPNTNPTHPSTPYAGHSDPLININEPASFLIERPRTNSLA